MPYIVCVDDNYHHGDESERYTHGQFDEASAALAACREVVDRFLATEHKPGMTAQDLWEQYTMFGDDPFIVCKDTPEVDFSAWDYARERCALICAGAV